MHTILATHANPWWLLTIQTILLLGLVLFCLDMIQAVISGIVRGVILIGQAIRGDVTYQGYSGSEEPSQARRGQRADVEGYVVYPHDGLDKR